MSMAATSPENRLKELLTKELDLKSSGGSLSLTESKEKNSLVSSLGVLKSSLILEATVSDLNKNSATTASPVSPGYMNSATNLPSMSPSNTAPSKIIQVQEKPIAQAPSANTGTSALGKQGGPSQVVSEQGGPGSSELLISKNPEAQSKTEATTPDEKKSFDSPKYSDVEKKTVLKKRVKTPPPESTDSTKLISKKEEPIVGRDLAASFIKNKHMVYEPIPRGNIRRQGSSVERGSLNIVHDYIGINDAYRIEMCIDSAVAINLEDKKMEIQDVFLTDAKVFFDAKKMNNNLGVVIRQIDSVPEGFKRETDLYLFRKSDDKPYLIKITGLPCPQGKLNFPNVVYLKEREQKDETIKQFILPPEDMVAEVTKGYKRVNEDKINVYDFIPDSAAAISLLAIEIVSDKKDGAYNFVITNNLGSEEVQIDSMRFLDKSSAIKSRQEGKNVYRYILYPKINKDYVINRRHLNIFAISNERKTYQHLQIDLLPMLAEKSEKQDLQ